MSKAQGQFTIVDYNDALTLTGYIGSNLAKTQIYNPDNDTYTPDWKTTNLVLTPSLYVIGTTTDQITSSNVTSVKWYIGSSTTVITSTGNYALSGTKSHILTVKANVIVRLIYRLFLDGKSQAAIYRELESLSIPSPGGKPTLSKTTVTSILQNEKYKGDALLQKKFTIDFLEKKMKPNEGEVPQYYVENSHPAIIDPDEWDHVQAELARRKSLGRAYSSKSVFSAKLVCEECGSFFGSKVWHSTDQYRRRIWQCNGKFSNEERCHTPTLDTETIQRLFIQAYNQLMSDRKQTIADCELARKCLTDFAVLDAEIERQLEETQVIAEMVKAAVKENASTAQSQETYLKKYEALTERYEKAAAELERLQAERTARIRQEKKIALFIRTLKKLPDTMTEWDDTIWTVMVEKAIVHKDGGITFVF